VGVNKLSNDNLAMNSAAVRSMVSWWSNLCTHWKDNLLTCYETWC